MIPVCRLCCHVGALAKDGGEGEGNFVLGKCFAEKRAAIASTMRLYNGSLLSRENHKLGRQQRLDVLISFQVLHKSLMWLAF